MSATMANGADPPIRDIVLFEAGGDPFDRRRAGSPPIRERVEIGGGVYIEAAVIGNAEALSGGAPVLSVVK